MTTTGLYKCNKRDTKTEFIENLSSKLHHRMPKDQTFVSLNGLKDWIDWKKNKLFKLVIRTFVVRLNQKSP